MIAKVDRNTLRVQRGSKIVLLSTKNRLKREKKGEGEGTKGGNGRKGGGAGLEYPKRVAFNSVEMKRKAEIAEGQLQLSYFEKEVKTD